MQLFITTDAGSRDITQLVPSVKWSGDYRQAARRLDFLILSPATDKSIPIIDSPLGAAVQLKQDGKLLFDGFIISRSKSTDGNQLDVSCFDRGFYLKRNQANYKFSGVTPEAAAAMIASDFGFTLGEAAKTGVPISRLFLTGTTTLYDILQTMYTLASKTTGKQYYTGFQGDKLYVIEKGPSQKTLLLEGKTNLIAAAMSESIENAVSCVAVYGADGALLQTLKDSERMKLYGRLQEAIQQGKGEDKTPEAKKMLENGGPSQKITVDCLGDISNITGGSVVLKESYTGLCGLFYIESDIHEWKRGQYFNRLTLNFQSLMDEKEAGSLPKKE